MFDSAITDEAPNNIKLPSRNTIIPDEDSSEDASDGDTSDDDSSAGTSNVDNSDDTSDDDSFDAYNHQSKESGILLAPINPEHVPEPGLGSKYFVLRYICT